jgi:hypothetical protein
LEILVSKLICMMSRKQFNRSGQIITKSTHPHQLQSHHHIRQPKPHGLAHFEVWDQSRHAPVVELAAADFQMCG